MKFIFFLSLFPSLIFACQEDISVRQYRMYITELLYRQTDQIYQASQNEDNELKKAFISGRLFQNLEMIELVTCYFISPDE